MSLEMFSGKESPVIWLSKLQELKSFHNVNNERTLQAITMAFQDSAATWLANLNEDTKTNMDQFKAACLQRFDKSFSDITMLNIKQRHDESTDTYVGCAESLALGHGLDEKYKTPSLTS